MHNVITGENDTKKTFKIIHKIKKDLLHLRQNESYIMKHLSVTFAINVIVNSSNLSEFVFLLLSNPHEPYPIPIAGKLRFFKNWLLY